MTYRSWDRHTQYQNPPSTVKLVYKDHPRGQQYVVLIHRWSLYTGSVRESMSLGTCKTWSLKAGGLYIQVVFTAGFTVHVYGHGK